MDVKEIEEAIVQLSAEELATLVGWLDDYRAQLWDRQIAQDLQAGRLDSLLAEVEEDYRTGTTKPL
jgi:hypothetical protein